MAKVTCTVCGKEIDSRGITGHMKTHKKQDTKEQEIDTSEGVISYPTNEPVQEPVKKVKKEVKPSIKQRKKNTKEQEPVQEPVKKPKSSKNEWKGFFQ